MRHVGNKRHLQNQGRCQVEALEARQLMSGSTAPIYIQGTGGPDNVELHFIDYKDGHTGFRWTVNGVTYTRNDCDPSSIQIFTYGGNDWVKVTSTRPGQELDIDTGSNDDVVMLGDYNGPAFDFNNFGNVFVQMGTGKNVFDVYSHTSKTPDINNVYSFDSNGLNAGGTSKATGQKIGGANVSFFGANTIQWYGPDQATRFKINTLAAGEDFTPFGGAGNDEFDVGAGSLDGNIHGKLHIKGGAGSDGVMFLDQNDTGDDAYSLYYNQLAKSGFGQTYLTIDYNAQNVFLYANQNNNETQVFSAMPWQHYYLYGDGGSNNFSLPITGKYGDLNGAKINVVGGTGSSTLTVLDYTKGQPASYSLSESSFYKVGGSYIQYAGVKHVQFRFAGTGSDQLWLSPSRYATYEIVDTTNGPDQVKLNLYGAQKATFVDGGNVKSYTFANRKTIDLIGVGKYPTTLAVDTLISGKVFNDVNGDALLDNTDAGIAGRKVYIDLNNNGKLDVSEDWQLTDANGNFNFAGYGPGMYVIRQVLPQGAHQTTPTPGSSIWVQLGDNQKVTGLKFGSQSF